MITATVSHRLVSEKCKPVMIVKPDPDDDSLMSLSLSGSHFTFRKDAAWQLIDLIAKVAGEKT